jgi:hypothetical protein
MELKIILAQTPFDDILSANDNWFAILALSLWYYLAAFI